MQRVKIWFREQWAYKKFCILIWVMAGLTLVFGFEFYLFQYSAWKSIRYLTLFWVLGMIAWVDQGSKRIPNAVLADLLAVRTFLLILECLFNQKYWLSILISAGLGMVLGGGMFLLCFLLARGGIGAGDVKLLGVIGYCVGGGAIFTLIFLTALLAALYSVLMLALKKTSLKQEIPFAPFVFAGTILTMMLGV